MTVTIVTKMLSQHGSDSRNLRHYGSDFSAQPHFAVAVLDSKVPVAAPSADGAICLTCRFGRCFCRLKPAEIATGDPHPSESAIAPFDGRSLSKVLLRYS